MGIAVSLAVSRNFMYLVPELADYLRVNALTKVQAGTPGVHQSCAVLVCGEDRADMDEGWGSRSMM